MIRCAKCDGDVLACVCEPVHEVKLLDHGFVRLVDHMGGDLAISRAARVSYDADWRAGDDEGSDARLIRRLWGDEHTSPFEAVEFQFEVMAPIFVFRQWHRHRTWVYNEVSARYCALPEVFYLPRPEDVGRQSKSNKQGRTTFSEDMELVESRKGELQYVDQHCVDAFGLYRELLEKDWPRELARMVLPLNTYSRMFGKVDLLNLLKFVRLRNHEHAQMEIRVYAGAIVDLVRPVVPVTIDIFEKYLHRQRVIDRLRTMPVERLEQIAADWEEGGHMTRVIKVKGYTLGKDGKLKRASIAKDVSARIRERKSKKVRVTKRGT